MQDNKDQQTTETDKAAAAAGQSSADRKNEAVTHQTPTATDRVKPRSGDGLANEGTNVSYEEER